MPPRLAPNLVAVWAALSPEDRATVVGWERILGLPPGGWKRNRHLRALLPVIGALRLAGSLPGLSSRALDDACTELGLEDDSDRHQRHRPSDSVARRLRRWTAAAYPDDADTNVRPEKPDALYRMGSKHPSQEADQ